MTCFFSCKTNRVYRTGQQSYHWTPSAIINLKKKFLHCRPPVYCSLLAFFIYLYYPFQITHIMLHKGNEPKMGFVRANKFLCFLSFRKYLSYHSINVIYFSRYNSFFNGLMMHGCGHHHYKTAFGYSNF